MFDKKYLPVNKRSIRFKNQLHFDAVKHFFSIFEKQNIKSNENADD